MLQLRWSARGIPVVTPTTRTYMNHLAVGPSALATAAMLEVAARSLQQSWRLNVNAESREISVVKDSLQAASLRSATSNGRR